MLPLSRVALDGLLLFSLSSLLPCMSAPLVYIFLGVWSLCSAISFKAKLCFYSLTPGMAILVTKYLNLFP